MSFALLRASGIAALLGVPAVAIAQEDTENQPAQGDLAAQQNAQARSQSAPRANIWGPKTTVRMRSPALVVGGIVFTIVGGGGLITVGGLFTAANSDGDPNTSATAATFFVLGGVSALVGLAAIGWGAVEVPVGTQARVWITPAGVAGRF